MTHQIELVQEASEKQRICRTIIEGLHDWFGIPEANEAYIQQVSDECFIAIKDANLLKGFISAKCHNSKSAEITIMGVPLCYHREGIGKTLLTALEAELKATGLEYLTVKTLAETRSDASYEKTRRFYNAMGFVELEIINEIWGEDNPCSFMAKKL